MLLKRIYIIFSFTELCCLLWCFHREPPLCLLAFVEYSIVSEAFKNCVINIVFCFPDICLALLSVTNWQWSGPDSISKCSNWKHSIDISLSPPGPQGNLQCTVHISQSSGARSPAKGSHGPAAAHPRSTSHPLPPVTYGTGVLWWHNTCLTLRKHVKQECFLQKGSVNCTWQQAASNMHDLLPGMSVSFQGNLYLLPD